MNKIDCKIVISATSEMFPFKPTRTIRIGSMKVDSMCRVPYVYLNRLFNIRTFHSRNSLI